MEGILTLAEALIRCRTTEGETGEMWRAFHLVRLWWDEALGIEAAAAMSTCFGSEGETRPLLLLHPDGNPAPGILLHAHLDVAKGAETCFHPARKGDRLYGRGAADMKGAAAVMLHLSAALLPRRDDFGLLLTFNEEVGGKAESGLGTEIFLRDLARDRPRFFLSGERSGLRVANRSKGVLRFEIALGGRAAHAATPWQGSNALEKLLAGLQQIDRQKTTDPSATTVALTFLAAGGRTALGTVPDRAMAGIDARIAVPEDRERLLTEVKKALPNARIELLLDEPPASCREDEVHVAKLLLALQSCGEEPSLYTKPHASDVRIVNGYGIPGVVFGPAGDGVHGDDEWVSISSLAKYRSILSRFLTD